MHSTFRLLMKLVGSLLLGSAGWAQTLPEAVPEGTTAVAVSRVRPSFPMLQLPDAKSQGERAIQLLGDRLQDVAAWYGKSGDELRAMLANDRMLKVDRRGRLFVEDELIAPLPALVPQVAASPLLDGSLLPLDQTYLLNSRPGAKRTIYLNFRGATLSNTAWSASTITALPFDMDGVPYTNSTAELQRIQYIWQRVAEDFAPFDVNVTTEPQPIDRLTRSGSTDDVYGTTVLITSRAGVYSCSCGGVAYLGVFDDTTNYYKPALVFSDALGANEKSVAEAITHEAGHNMGLNHDGTASLGYYTGHGSGATGWAPIMGVGYYQALVQWSRGQYSGANNVQDDYVVMQSNGLPLRPDDHGGAVSTATALARSDAGGVSSFSGTGVIERPGDVDMFSFSASAGTVSITLTPAARSPNLDAVIELRNAANQVLATSNPLDTLNAALSVALPSQGTYYVSVSGTGKGDPLTTGYTNYGSLGQYALSVSAAASTNQPPVAVLAAAPTSGTVPLTVQFSSAGSSDPDGSITAVQWNFGDGTSASGATAAKVYGMAGQFTAELRVTDNAGLTSLRSVLIDARAPVVAATSRVSDIAMSLSLATNGRARAIAVVTVRDGNGNLLNGATVQGRWSGLVSGNAVATTTAGKATFSSLQTRNRGTFVFTVTGVTLAGTTYNPALNVETQDSITR